MKHLLSTPQSLLPASLLWVPVRLPRGRGQGVGPCQVTGVPWGGGSPDLRGALLQGVRFWGTGGKVLGRSGFILCSLQSCGVVWD